MSWLGNFSSNTTPRGRAMTPDRFGSHGDILNYRSPSPNYSTIPGTPPLNRQLMELEDLYNVSWRQQLAERQNREQPIFTTKAHVFQIDPETKKNWIPASKQATSISYYFDTTRNTYRIISVEGSKAIINSTITPNLTFTKTSQKFGQWSDPRANTVYGLGFTSEADLSKFVEKFKEIKELCKNQQNFQPSQAQMNGTVGDENHVPPQAAASPHMNRQFFHPRSSSLTSVQNDQPHDQATNLRERRNSFNSSNGNTNSLPANATEAQLKYENDRLKLALAQSSANAKKWEIELQTLKNNNARLTAALQESTANVEEWKKQLAAYKEESCRMKKKVLEMDKKHGSERVKSLHLEVQQLSGNMEQLQRDNHQKQEEIDRLHQQIRDFTAKESLASSLQSRIIGLEDENGTLSLRVQDFQRRLHDSTMSQDEDKRELLHLQDQLGSKITELYELHEQVVSVIRKESNS